MRSHVGIKGIMVCGSFELKGETAFIGRSLKNDIQIKDSAISRKHLKIFRIGKKFFVEDLRSTNGTMINGEPIAPGEGFEVDEKDVISIGHTVIRLDELPPSEGLDVKIFKTRHPRDDSGEGDQTTRERRSRSSKDLELIYKVSELLRKSLGTDEFLEKVVDLIIGTLPRIDTVAILLYDIHKRQIKEVFSHSREGMAKDGEIYSQSTVKQVLKDHKPIRMSNINYEQPDDFSDSESTMKIGSIMCVPMISNSELRGVIYVDSIRAPYGFRKEDLLLLNALSGPVAVAIEKASPAS
ncbi:MAG: FHA domain-containing protein [Deltaproteobacteria bacterium]|nr:FHA domain-containing protein [Deltaproteobacteria bacterium]